MGKKVTVLGFGGTGQVLAASFAIRGLDATLAFFSLPEAEKQFENIKNKGGILIHGNGERGLATPRVTTDLKSALADTDVIIVSTVANYHDQLAHAVSPFVRDGHVFLIGPGNAGSIVFSNAFKKDGVKAKVLIAETQGNFCSARITGAGEVITANVLGLKKIAALPATDTPAVQAALSGIIETEPLKNVLETTLNSPNIINHLVATVLNTGKIDNKGKDFKLFIDGLSDTVVKGLEAATKEWQSVLTALAIWQMPSPVDHINKIRQYDKYPEFDVFRSLDGPFSIKHRYVSEDAGAAVTLLISFARLLNIPVPFTEGLVSIAGALNDTDFYANGLNLNNLGLGGKSVEQIKSYLQTGNF